MASNKVTIDSFESSTTMHVVVSFSRQFRVRVWIGLKLIRLGAAVMRIGIVVDDQEEKKS
jgi:hypothetical protein